MKLSRPQIAYRITGALLVWLPIAGLEVVIWIPWTLLGFSRDLVRAATLRIGNHLFK